MTTRRRRGLSVLAGLAMTLTACGQSAVESIRADVAAAATSQAASQTTAPPVDSVALPTTTATADASTKAPRGGGSSSPAILAAVAESDATTVHTAMYLGFEMEVAGEQMRLGSDQPLMVGVMSGSRYEMSMDLGAMFDHDMLASLGGIDLADLRMEVVGDESVTYLKAPFLSLPEFSSGLGPSVPDLGDGWGVLHIDDLTGTLGDVFPEDILAAVGGQSAQSTDQWFALASAIRLLDDEGEPSSSRGDPTTRFTGTLAMTELFAHGGLDLADFDTMAASIAGPTSGLDGLSDLMAQIEIDMTIDVDATGRVREMTMRMNLGTFITAIAQNLGEPPLDDPAFMMTMRVELYDYSDEAVEIVFPSDDEVTADLGAWMSALLGA